MIKRVQITSHQPTATGSPDVVRVDGSTKWAPRYRLLRTDQPALWAVVNNAGVVIATTGDKNLANEVIIGLFRGLLTRTSRANQKELLGYTSDDVRSELRGKTLGCTCDPDERCHADVLWEVANYDTGSQPGVSQKEIT